MARFETIKVGRKTGKVPEYLKGEVGKKPKSKIKITPGPKVAKKMEEALEKTKIYVYSEKKKEVEIKKAEPKLVEDRIEQEIIKTTVDEDLVEGNDLSDIEIMEEVEEEKPEKPETITTKRQLKHMFKDELIQLAKSLNVDEKGTKSELVERLMDKLGIKE